MMVLSGYTGKFGVQKKYVVKLNFRMSVDYHKGLQLQIESTEVKGVAT
jgi:hypothetical protein